MCFKQAVWKPSFATMCGLVVPVALAHALVLRLFWNLVTMPRDLPRTVHADDIKPVKKLLDLSAHLLQATSVTGLPKLRRAVLVLSAFHSLNHYHGHWRGRSRPTSCGGCFETKLDVCHWFENECMHIVFSVWLLAFVGLDFVLAMWSGICIVLNDHGFA